MRPNAANNRCKWSAAEFASELICLVRRLVLFPNHLDARQELFCSGHCFLNVESAADQIATI